MGNLHDSIHVGAPVNKVLTYMDEPDLSPTTALEERP